MESAETPAFSQVAEHTAGQVHEDLFPAELAAEEQRLPEAAFAPSAQIPEPVILRAEPQFMPPVHSAEDEKISVAHISMLPGLTMLHDREATLSVIDAAKQWAEFVPYDASSLLMRQGALWLYYPLDAAGDPVPHTLWMDLGCQLPPHISVWHSTDGQDWTQTSPAMRGVYSLKNAGKHGHVLIRMDGMPGVWFSPSLIPLPSVLDSPERDLHILTLVALGFMALLCLLLSITDRNEARFWCFVLASAAAVQSAWAIPATESGIGVAALPGIFAAGIVLILLPHIGRVLMRTREEAPTADVFFLLLALPGACAALLPLLPGMAWTARLLVFWPFAALMCVLPALPLLFRGIPGSCGYVLACLAFCGGAFASCWGMGQGMDASLWAFLVPAGVLFGLIVLVGASARRENVRHDFEPEEADLEPEPVEEDPRELAAVALRRALKGTVEELLDGSCRLDQAISRVGLDDSKMSIMTHADNMVAAARRISERIMVTSPSASLPSASDSVFELREVIQTAFASAFDEAEKKGLGLSWYAAPHLGVRYRGDSARLTALLSLLLSDAVRASSRGAVSLRVRRARKSTHPGHLLFTVADTGTAQPPRGRSSDLLSRVWEFAASSGGDVTLTSGPHGTSLSFSMECMAYDGAGQERETPAGQIDADGRGRLVIAASSDDLTRQMLFHYLDGLGMRVWEACSAAEAASLYMASPASLVVFDGSLLEEDMIQALAAVRMFEGEQTLRAAPFLLLAKSTLQAERMSKAGCDEALLPPLIRKDLRALVKWLIAPAGTMSRPVLSSQRVTLAAVLAGAHSGELKLQRKGDRKGMRAEKVTSEETDSHDAALAPVPVGCEPVEDVPAQSEMPVESGAVAAECLAGNGTEEVSTTGEALLNEVSMEAPLDRVDGLLGVLSEALKCLDTGTVRRGSAELALLADGYGMHTLADMARCFRAAWEEGDVDAAAQIVEEMRAEAARQ